MKSLVKFSSLFLVLASLGGSAFAADAQFCGPVTAGCDSDNVCGRLRVDGQEVYTGSGPKSARLEEELRSAQAENKMVLVDVEKRDGVWQVTDISYPAGCPRE